MKDDMKPRLETVEDGDSRLEKILDDTARLTKDILLTCPEKQRRRFADSLDDYAIQLVPKFTPKGDKVIIGKERLKELVDMAQEKCMNCVEDGVSAEKCRLYQWLILEVPTDQEGSGLVCPYSRAEWA